MDAIDNHINYIEFKAQDLEPIRQFYNELFGWTFTDYGPTYTAFSHSGLKGGLEKSDDEVVNGALILLYYSDLKSIQEIIVSAHGKISKDIFSFPG